MNWGIAFFLSSHAYRPAGDISVTVCFSVWFSVCFFVHRIFGNGYLGRGLT